MRRRRCVRRDQPDEAGIRAATHALQHHVADAGSRLGAALLQRLATRIVKAGPGKIAKTGQRSRRGAGADQRAVARESRDRGIDAVDEALQPLDQRHRAADRFGGGDQNAVAAVGEIKPGAAASHQPAERRAETAQPLQPDRAAEPACQLHHLTPLRIRRSEVFAGQRDAIGCAEQRGPDRIGPQDTRAIDRPQPGGQGACRMQRQPRIAEASQLEFRIIHRSDITAWACCCSTMATDRLSRDDSLKEVLVSPAGDGRSTAGRPRRRPKPR